jgi:hypothetical protein
LIHGAGIRLPAELTLRVASHHSRPARCAATSG